MLFKDYHIPMIRSGSKTVTRREWKENHHGPNVGSVVMAASVDMVPDDADHGSPMLLAKDECDCFIRVQEVYEQPLCDMTDADARKEGDYATVGAFIDGYENVYGAGSWDPAKVVDVVAFEYVGTAPEVPP